MLTVKEAAQVFRVSPKTIRRWANSGRLEIVRLPGGQIRVPRSAVAGILVSSRAGSADQMSSIEAPRSVS